MHNKFVSIIFAFFLFKSVLPAQRSSSILDVEPTPTPTLELLSADALLQMVNQARLQIGHPALVMDPILMAYVQTEAEKAANSIPSNGKGDLQNVIDLGYGYPETIDTIFCTSSYAILENNSPFPTGFGTPAERAVNNVYYSHIGFGVSKGTGEWEGYVYYLLTACYTADRLYKPGQVQTPGLNSTTVISDIIIPVRTALPQADGRIVHEVLSGQTLWAIAIAYQIHIQDILTLNQLPQNTTSLHQGQKLWIPTTQGKKSVLTPSPGSPTKLSPSKISPDTFHHTSTSRPSVIPTSATTPLPAGESSGLEISANGVIISLILIGCLVFFISSILRK